MHGEQTVGNRIQYNRVRIYFISIPSKAFSTEKVHIIHGWVDFTGGYYIIVVKEQQMFCGVPSILKHIFIFM